jgi:hypothetical protein
VIAGIEGVSDMRLIQLMILTDMLVICIGRLLFGVDGCFDAEDWPVWAMGGQRVCRACVADSRLYSAV